MIINKQVTIVKVVSTHTNSSKHSKSVLRLTLNQLQKQQQIPLNE
jgi:hypothetical protein